MTGPNRPGDGGIVLVNVLVILAIAATLVFLMLSSQDVSLQRAQALSAASAADALARGAEASVVTALRRDLVEGPGVDHPGEPWARAGQDETQLDSGRFSVTITDAQSKLNLSRLRSGNLQETQPFLRLLAALDLPAALGPRVIAEVASRDGVSGLDALESLTSDTRALLDPYLAILPPGAKLNLNTANPLLLEVVLNNRAAALRLQGRRDRQGFLTQADLAQVGVQLPSGAGFASHIFDADIVAEVDDVVVPLQSRIVRRQVVGSRQVVVARRQYGLPSDQALPPPATVRRQTR